MARDNLDGILLFRANYQPGDYEAIAKLLTPLPDEDRLHTRLGDLLEVVQANPGVEAGDCLLFAYEHSPCSYCRGTCLRLLLTLHQVPNWVIEEARFDASPEVTGLCPGPA